MKTMKFTVLSLVFAILVSFKPATQAFQGQAFYFSKSTMDLGQWGARLSEAEKKQVYARLKNRLEKTYILDFNKEESVFNEEDQISIVRLHGNKIAEIGEGFIRLFDGGWQTNTTKSRLNAILEGNGCDGDKVFAKNFDWFVQMDTRQGLTVVPFFSSMRLG